MTKCRVCIEKIPRKTVVALPCGHLFHTGCVIKLVEKRTRKCPLCRTRIPWHKKQLVRHLKLFKE